MKRARRLKRPKVFPLMTHVVEFCGVDLDSRIASFMVRATNQLGTRTIAGAYLVPDDVVLARLSSVQVGSKIRATARESDRPRPCAMTLVDFEVVAP